MIIDDVDMEDLPNNAEEAFIVFEGRLRSSLERAKSQDRFENTENNTYVGDYSPERHYVSSMLAFLDEYALDYLSVKDITSLPNFDFLREFNIFFNAINYAKTRFKLRKSKIDTGQAGTPIAISFDYKSGIHENLNTIRKIVNQQIHDQNKKDSIFKKIADLASEIDRDRTTVDAVFSRCIDLTKTLSKCGEILEPAVQKIERVMRAITNSAEKVNLLPKKERQQSLPAPKETKIDDDEIPF